MKIFLSFFLTLILVSSNAQDKGIETIEFENYSSYNTTELNNSIRAWQSSRKYDSIIFSVMEIIGIPNSDIEIRSTNSFGAFAIILRECKQRYFLFNEFFFDSVLTVTKSYNCIKSICFHEIAHHFYHHPLKSSWEAHIHELEADRYSGFQMRLIGATLEESIATMNHFGNEKDIHSHPNKYKRIAEIKAGYLDASRRIFNDTTIFESDSLIFNLGILLAFQKLEVSQKSVNSHKKEKSLIDTSLTHIQLYEYPTYSLLGHILCVNEKMEVIDIATDQVVGLIKTPYKDATFQLLKLESSIYRIEDGDIFSINQIGTKIKLGTKIN